MGISIMPHYSIIKMESLEELRQLFPDGVADEMNFVLFSTSGVHGSYETLEDIKKTKGKYGHKITVLVVQPRLVCLRYGHLEIYKKDLKWLSKLRRSSKKAMAGIWYTPRKSAEIGE